MQTSLPVIRSLARSGAIELAWSAFEEAGWHERDDLPEALCLKGRLFKDRAALASPGQRGAWLDQAINAYLAAFDLSPATYPLINAATLALLSGDTPRAEALARLTIELLDSGTHEPETPYWLAATRAEAMLLLGDAQGSAAMVKQAVALAPRAWEDHASTLAQFSRIAEHLGLAVDGLEDIRPPASLSYRGTMGLSPQDRAASAQIEAVLNRERPGFLYGALAAGADILIAEAGLRLGARLHVLLPASLEAFRALSVMPFGKEWGARFDDLCAAAESVEMIATPGPPSVAGVALAQAMVRGLAVVNARELQSRVLTLEVDCLPPSSRAEGVSSPAPGLRTIRIACAETVGAATSPLADDQQLLAIVAWPEGSAAIERESGYASWCDLADGIWAAAYSDPGAAVAAVRRLERDSGKPLSIGLDYVLAPAVLEAPGDVAAGARAIARTARPGQWLASRAMALSLVGEADGTMIQPVGEVRCAACAIDVYAITGA